MDANMQLTINSFRPLFPDFFNETSLTFSKINVKKLQFIHKLTASDTSKTAKITKKVILPTSTSPKCQCAAE